MSSKCMLRVNVDLFYRHGRGERQNARCESIGRDTAGHFPQNGVRVIESAIPKGLPPGMSLDCIEIKHSR